MVASWLHHGWEHGCPLSVRGGICNLSMGPAIARLLFAKGHALMNHPACETPAWQFIAGSLFKPRLDSLRVKTQDRHVLVNAIKKIKKNIFPNIKRYYFSHVWRHNCSPVTKKNTSFTRCSTVWFVWFLSYVFISVRKCCFSPKTESGRELWPHCVGLQAGCGSPWEISLL